MDRMKAPFHEDLGDSAQPVEGFQYPETGDTIECLQDFELGDCGHTVLPAGTTGTVTGLRLPGSLHKEHGYIGCVVFFQKAAEPIPPRRPHECTSRPAPYPAGLVIPWDFVSNPKNFKFEKPQTPEPSSP